MDFRPKDGSDADGSDFHGQKRNNETHASTTDPHSRFYPARVAADFRLNLIAYSLVRTPKLLAV